jgi:CRP-like cAMP-binding protein
MSSQDSPSLSRYLDKMERRAPLSPAAREAFLALPKQVREYEAYRDIVREGDRPVRASFVESGLVSRYKTLRNGARQIMSFHIPGDLVDLQSALIVVADHGMRAHGNVRTITVAHHDLLNLAADFPEIARAFWFDTLIDAAIFREWTVDIGRRNSRERTAHLLLEMATLHDDAGLLVDDTFNFPITQNDLSDAVGMTPVHLNRVLQWMRRECLIRTHGRAITIENRVELQTLAGFDRGYLHPEGPRIAAIRRQTDGAISPRRDPPGA